MAITYVGSTGDAASGFISTGAWTLSGISWQVGDLAIFWLGINDDAIINTITPPATITTKINTVNNAAGTRMFIGYRRLEIGDTTFTWNTDPAFSSLPVWGVDIFRGDEIPSSGDPFNAASSLTQITTVNPDNPAVTPTMDDSLIYLVFAKRGASSGFSASPPTNYSLAGSEFNPSVGAIGRCGVTGYRALSGGANSPENPSAWSLTNATLALGATWTGAIGGLPLGRLTSGDSAAAAEYHHKKNRKPSGIRSVPGQAEYHRGRLEEAKGTLTRDEELAITLISMMEDEE